MRTTTITTTTTSYFHSQNYFLFSCCSSTSFRFTIPGWVRFARAIHIPHTHTHTIHGQSHIINRILWFSPESIQMLLFSNNNETQNVANSSHFSPTSFFHLSIHLLHLSSSISNSHSLTLIWWLYLNLSVSLMLLYLNWINKNTFLFNITKSSIITPSTSWGVTAKLALVNRCCCYLCCHRFYYEFRIARAIRKTFNRIILVLTSIYIYNTAAYIHSTMVHRKLQNEFISKMKKDWGNGEEWKMKYACKIQKAFVLSVPRIAAAAAAEQQQQ